MKIETYLVFRGDCRRAFELYHAVLGGTMVTMLAHRDSPADQFVPDEWLDKILHARLEIGAHAIIGSDAPPGHQNPMSGFHVFVKADTEDEAQRIFQALSEGAQAITLPLQHTFWARTFGMLSDRFGVPWMVSGPG